MPKQLCQSAFGRTRADDSEILIPFNSGMGVPNSSNANKMSSIVPNELANDKIRLAMSSNNLLS